MKYDDKKLKGLFSRVYNNRMVVTEEVNEEKDMIEYSKRVFGEGGQNPDPSLLHQFNNLVVEQADEIAKPKVTDMIGLLANTQMKKRGDVVKINIPQKNKIRLLWSAKGSGVDLVRVGGQKSIVAVPKTFSTGIYYEPLDFVTNPVVAFKDLVNSIAEAKVKLYLDKIAELTSTALAGGKIPTANQLTGSNVTYANYNKLAATIMRYGGTPIFVADSLLIDHIAGQMATEKADLISDNMRDELLTSLVPTKLGRTIAVNLVNPFVDERNEKVELPIDTGYMFAGGVNQKPFTIIEFGGMRQKTEQDMEDERVKMKLFQDADVKLMFGEALGYVKDDTITL